MERKKVIQYVLFIGVWLLVLWLLNYVFSLRTSSFGTNDQLPGHSHFKLALIALIFKTAFIAAVIFYILPQFSKKRKLWTFIAQSASSLLVCFISEQYIQAYITRTSWPGFAPHSHGLLRNNPFWLFNLVLYFLFLLVIGSYHFIKEWVHNEKMKRHLIETQFTTELNYLKSQVNPHFLFNTLNNLFSIAQRNNDTETANGISKLAGLMRYMIYDSSVTRISLEKEIKNLQDYIALAKLRYTNDEVTVDITISGDTSKAAIAPMLLMPFVENAFKHGTSIEGRSVINISVTAAAKKIIFSCTNPIVNLNLSAVNEEGGIGLENVKRRLILLYPQKHKLNITDDGKLFTINLEVDT